MSLQKKGLHKLCPDGETSHNHKFENYKITVLKQYTEIEYLKFTVGIWININSNVSTQNTQI